MPPSSNAVTVLLECLHDRIFRGSYPAAGELILCPRCNNYRKVTGVTAQIRSKCDGKWCRYAQTWGVGSAGDFAHNRAVRSAGNHINKYPDHMVTITDTQGTVTRVKAEGVEELPFDVPRAVPKEHGRSLRNLRRPAS